MAFIVGIDEAGRGPLAGPVAIGAVLTDQVTERKFFKDIQDSKKLSEEDREIWYSFALEERRSGRLNFAVALVSERVIDKHGIAYAIRLGIKRVLKKLAVPADTQVFLDGGIKAPAEFVHQKTVIKGDEKIPVISLASICAKVTRDRYMVRVSRKYPEFGFHIHKGYGTKVHRDLISKYGPSAIHRRSFLGKLT